MLGDISVAENIYIICGTTDMRKSIDGLCSIVRDKLSMDPDQSSLFLFCGKRCDRIKVLLHEPDGYVIKELNQCEEHEVAFSDEVLHKYHVTNVEQEVCIRGDFVIVFPDYILETKYLAGGISLSSKDIPRIKRTEVHTNNTMTIENKTAFYHFDNRDYSTIYLGGFANRHQICFLKKLYLENLDHRYYHFGDIDVGGFLIHQHLCHATGIDFGLYNMGVEGLRNIRYRHCLQKLSRRDLERIQGLIDHPMYQKVVAEMMKDEVKLEQEIVCYDIVESEK